MDTPEAAFNVWILTGNAMNLLLRAVPAEAFADAVMRERLLRLDEAFKDLPPDETLVRLHALPADDRALLVTACRQAMTLAGSEAESMLGLTMEEAEAVLRLLQHEAGQ